MNSNKNVKYILPATTIDMGGFPVKQALPTQNIQQLDPFLLLHHARAKFNKDRPAKHQGIGPHPHRGFAPVTFVIEGEVQHRDSWGNNQVAKTGEVQWMYSGAGIVHSERPTQDLVESGGYQEIVQLWVNSSSNFKKTPPKYHHLSAANMP
ncbi:MAG: pirin family protein, partial [Flavobacteriales bacterium]